MTYSIDTNNREGEIAVVSTLLVTSAPVDTARSKFLTITKKSKSSSQKKHLYDGGMNSHIQELGKVRSRVLTCLLVVHYTRV